MRRGGLSDKQKRFVDEYLKDLNARAAYKRAGYVATGVGARVNASKLLTNTNVERALAVRRTAIERRTEISQDQVRRELGCVAFFDPRQLFDTETGRLIDVRKLPGEVAAAISSVEITTNGDAERVTKIRLCSKVEALDKLCRHLGMYEDRLRVTMGLERELAALTDEEIRGKLIELRSGDWKRVDGGGESAPAAAGTLGVPARVGREKAR